MNCRETQPQTKLTHSEIVESIKALTYVIEVFESAHITYLHKPAAQKIKMLIQLLPPYEPEQE